ncbi:MAG: carboxynorspermidine decarboxylase [Candidatus Omnitrophota bacterium]
MILPLNKISTPCYLIDQVALQRNLKILARVQKESGAKILLALKAFAAFSVFPLMRKYLAGTSASSLDEARLGFEEFGKEVHLCAPAYCPDQFPEIITYVDHIVFNSFSQWQRFKPQVEKYRKKASIKCGLRLNPRHSEVTVPLYDPCSKYSRLGITAENFQRDKLDGITGFHFHTLCELNSDALERTLKSVEAKFGKYLERMEWMNFGGGHHITKNDYDIKRLCRLIIDFRNRYGVEVYLEPGEAVVLNAGYLVASVLDIVHNEMDIAILDTSAATHIPDVLEMPYRPEIVGAGKPGQYSYTYRLGGLSCLAGDIIGDYSFPEPLKFGSKLVFLDMAHYSMVKNNTFNGVRLPSIAVYYPNTQKVKIIKTFTYRSYRSRLS